MEKYENPIELALLRINGQYWALNEDDSDLQLNQANEYTYINMKYDVDFVGHVKIPRSYLNFTEEYPDDNPNV
jgi:hypothetical protein